jgi:magnesium transporter
MAGLENDVEEVEVDVFGERSDETQRIYFLRRELAEFYRAVHPLLQPMELIVSAEHPDTSSAVRDHFRDIADHVKRVEDAISTQRELLTSILQANLAVISVQQNDVVKKISGWAAIITVPTFIASVYGMNFKNMPELRWHYGYYGTLVAMVVVGVILHRVLRRAGWL